MVDWQDFKKALGKTADRHSDKEIQQLNERAAMLAQLLFEIWYVSLKKSPSTKEDE